MKGKWIGFVLIAMGALLLFRNFFEFNYDFTLFVIGILFVAAYLSLHKGPKRLIGFLIPGCILIFLGFNDLIHHLRLMPPELESMAPLVFIGLAFLTIYLMSAAFGPKPARWALLVGLILLLLSVMRFIIENQWIRAENIFLYGMPVLLIFIGIFIFVGAIWRGRKKPL